MTSIYLDSFSISRRCFVNTLSATVFASTDVAWRRVLGDTISFFPSILSSTSASVFHSNISRRVWGTMMPLEFPIWVSFLTIVAMVHPPCYTVFNQFNWHHRQL